MSDLDVQIRSAITELVDSAPPPPPLPTVAPTPSRPPRRRPLVAVAIAVAVAVVTGAVVVTRGSGDAPVTTAARTPAAVAGCGTIVGHNAELTSERTVFLHRVGLTTRRTLQVSPSGEADAGAALFAKDGLLVKEALPVELIVPLGWRNRFSIEWGNSGRTDRLRVQRCPGADGRVPAGQPIPHLAWNAWVGGYFVAKASCVPLIIKAGGTTRTVHISVGKRCPGPLR